MKLLRRLESRSWTSESFRLAVYTANVVKTYSSADGAMVTRLSVTYENDEVVVQPENKPNVVRSISPVWLQSGFAGAAGANRVGERWLFEGIVEGTDSEMRELGMEGYDFRDLRSLSLLDLLEVLHADGVLKKPFARHANLIDEDSAEKEWGGALASGKSALASQMKARGDAEIRARSLGIELNEERRLRLYADARIAVLQTTHAVEAADFESAKKALTAERARVSELQQSLAEQRAQGARVGEMLAQEKTRMDRTSTLLTEGNVRLDQLSQSLEQEKAHFVSLNETILKLRGQRTLWCIIAIGSGTIAILRLINS